MKFLTSILALLLFTTMALAYNGQGITDDVLAASHDLIQSDAVNPENLTIDVALGESGNLFVMVDTDYIRVIPNACANSPVQPDIPREAHNAMALTGSAGSQLKTGPSQGVTDLSHRLSG